jgi:hypothetical protein
MYIFNVNSKKEMSKRIYNENNKNESSTTNNVIDLTKEVIEIKDDSPPRRKENVNKNESNTTNTEQIKSFTTEKTPSFYEKIFLKKNLQRNVEETNTNTKEKHGTHQTNIINTLKKRSFSEKSNLEKNKRYIKQNYNETPNFVNQIYNYNDNHSNTMNKHHHTNRFSNFENFQNIYTPYYRTNFSFPPYHEGTSSSNFGGIRFSRTEPSRNISNETNSFSRLNYINRDFNETDYEELLKLDEKNIKKIIPENEIRKYKKIKFIKNEKNEEDKCIICQFEYEKDETLIELPCKHNFHKSCIKNYLKNYNNKCPICKEELN